MKLPKNAYVKNAEGVIEEVAFDKAVANFAKEKSVKKDYALEVVKDVLKKEKVDFDSIEDPKERKAQKDFYKATEKFLETSDKLKKELSDSILEAEEEAKKKEALIAQAAQKGATAADKFGLTIASDFQKLLGPKFVANQYGLALAKGETISEDDVSAVVSTLAEGSEKVNELRSQTLIKLGDAVRIARKEFGEERGDQIVVQAVEVRGQGKYNVMQAEAVVSYIDELYPEQKDRPISLSFTHWQEAKNYGRNKKGENVIKPAKVRSILKKAEDEKLSCADLRDLLKAARPQVEPTPGDEGDEGDDGGDESPKATKAKALYGYLYESYETGDVTFSEELNEELLKEKAEDNTPAYKVFDLAGKAILKPNGKVESEIKDVA